MKTTAYIATSIDNYIADAKHGVDFLSTTNPDITEQPSDPDIYGFHKFINSIDALVMGRKTLDVITPLIDQWPYGEKPVIILTSHSDYEIAPKLPKTVETLCGLEPNQIIDTLAQRGFHHLYIDGGITISRFLQANLLSEIIITRIPIILGSGIPLFSSLSQHYSLTHKHTESFNTGITQSTYQINTCTL
ncbi:Dihydrofolate reductase [Poriferisphaera corsica]|uniref:Dihydrofolate reductase n=1 Tax=Poriferisphaera corsica TaxID=2528020 RepID=A0A517YQQ2_9BACT|nr:dihydrofolate reductase family protein [Poriferisphaera corsica]QDU32552.1 Dihydrofolate reductase [Poriferisphaera corsica]